MAQRPYRVIEPTFRVKNGSPVEALEKVLNDQYDEGYSFLTTTHVREENGQWVKVIVLRQQAV